MQVPTRHYNKTSRNTMVKELNYETALTVIESWEVLRRKKNYAKIMGRGLFVK
jgi:hypothetical protein